MLQTQQSAILHKQHIALLVSSFIFGMPIVANAQYMNLKNFFYRDYLDLGQNRGQFQPGNTNVTLQSLKNPGVSVTLPFEIPSFSARSQNGNMTALDRGFAATAWHVTSIDNCANQYNYNICTWGQTTYSITEHSQAPYGKDTRFVRMDKFIVEGSMPLLNDGIVGTTGVSSLASDKERQEQNKQKLLSRLEAMQDEHGNIYMLQAGQGYIKVSNGENGSDRTGIFGRDGHGIGSYLGMRGGSFGVVHRDINFNKLYVMYEKMGSLHNSGFGLGIRYDSNETFSNEITQGDSGSGYYAYDAKNKKWYLIGVVSETNGRVSYVAQSDFDDYRKKFEQTINLQNDKWTLNNKQLSNDKHNPNQTLQDNKDIILQGGGTIEVKSDLTLNDSAKKQSGGLVFMAENGASSTNPTRYTITQTQNGNHKFNGAGLDIADNVVVTWNLGLASPLHKIGAGTLEITTTSTPLNDKYELLRLGEGKVILNTNQKAFSNIYITSGRGTLELTKGKGEALGAIKDNSNSADSYKLEQNKNNEMGFTFGNYGGNLDLKGNSLTLNAISSNDALANIINSDTALSSMTIQGYGYDSNGNKGSSVADTIIHASFGQKTSTDSKAENSNNNIKLIYKNNTRPVDSNDKNGAALIFDGNLDIKSLESSNGNIVLQGHPTTHGYVRVGGHFEAEQKKLIEQLKRAEGKYLPDWMDLTRPSTLEQPDWDYRIFKIGTIDLKSSHLSIGRAGLVQGNITADKDSVIKLGGDVKHYIDKKDGENTDIGSISYKQEVEQGTLSNNSQLLANAQISYEGKITADGSTITSKIFDFNANLDLKNSAKLTADYLTLEQRAGTSNEVASLGDKTTANVKHILFKNISDTSKIKIEKDAKFSVENSITLEKSNINLSSFDFSKIGNMLVNNSSTATLNSGVGNYNLIVSNGSTFNNTGNDFLLTQGKQVALSGGSTMKIGTTAGNGTIKVDGSVRVQDFIAQDSKTQSYATQNTTGNTLQQNANTESSKCQNAQNLNGCLPSDNKPLDSINKPEPMFKTIIAVEKGSKLEFANFKADNNANVYLALDIETENSTKGNKTSTQKNFNIDAINNSNVYVNTWDFNKDSYDANRTASLKTDANSRIHFGTLQYDMAKTNYIARPIDANLSIYTSLRLNNVGKVQTGIQTKLPQSQMTKDITSNNVASPISQTFSQSDPLKLAAQAGTGDDRFHALQLKGNSASGLNDGKNLTLENGTRIEVNLDSSVKKGDTSNGFQLNKYYTLVSAGSITDNRSDKRIYFSFANGVTPLYYTTLVENGEIKVKFSEFNPSSYQELSKVIKDDKLLQILIEHNPQNDFVQMAGAANQHAELEEYLNDIGKGMSALEKSNSRAVSTNLLYANNETINTRVMQVKVVQPTISKYRLAMNDISISGSDSDLILSDASGFNELKLLLDGIDEARKKNNMWINVGGGFFNQNAGGQLVFYGTNLGYDRIFAFGESEYLIGAMAGIGGSNYDASMAKDNSLFYNFGFYVNTDITNIHELQSNINLSYIDSNKTVDKQGKAVADSMRSGTFGWLWSVYYKYKFHFGTIGNFNQVVKPVVFINTGFNGIGEFSGSFYKQKAYNDFNLALGAGGEYSLVKDNAVYSMQVLAKQGVLSTGKQIFVSLNNANDFIGYDLRNAALGLQLNFIGYNQFAYNLSLQYGISSLFDIEGNFGVKGDMRLQYKF